ncbi:DRTGG domain-containing protein [Streptococcus cuniculipharyngis]|uniref:CBS domain-containing protein n=1 Tax=Streptococcus cuniculipharyngis TaxID=1562651 RepID=A0A5C5SE74_9STRE|nr:DRTGG domain-containing protein [Streptococcus cuniculipharyngis]TWS99089.1 CBS domain-containing protein [Streptococcus cuniculipharyngis]
MSKHQEILDYLENLAVGKRVSVRRIASRLNVSDGTAYRAIKEAENRGLVETHPRSGTVRIHQKQGLRFDQLRYAEIAQISESVIVAGHQGLEKEFSRFAIGAMTKENIRPHLARGGLLIVGDRTDIQELALEMGNAILVTGGFPVEARIRDLADGLAIPIMVSHHDTFTVATLIHQAFTIASVQSQTKRIADIYQSKESYGFLGETATVADYLALKKATNRVRFPLVNGQGKIIGVISLRDIVGYTSKVSLTKLMSENPVSTCLAEGLDKISQIMILEDFDMLPVIDEQQVLLGVVTRRQVMENLMQPAYQPLLGHARPTLLSQLVRDRNNFSLVIEPWMLDARGQFSKAALTELLTLMTGKITHEVCQNHIIIEQMMIYWLEEILLGAQLVIQARPVFSTSKQVIDYTLLVDKKEVGKAIITSKVD